jgi:hypothetical protein
MNKPVNIIGVYEIGDIRIPIADDGRLLDWMPGSEGEELAGIYGPTHFRIGDDKDYVTLDFIELPNGTIYVHVTEPFPILHCEDHHSIFSRDEVVEFVFRKIERILDGLKKKRVEHDTEFHGADAWYFLRAVGTFVDHPSYDCLNQNEMWYGEDY